MQLKSNFSNVALTSLIFFVALITGCSSGSKTTPATTTPSGTFSVASSSPASGATQVATTAAILVTFSGPANATTVNTTNITLTSGKNSAVAGAVTYNATTYVATITPTAALAANITYTLTVTGVTSSSGTVMTGPFTATFTTAAGSSSGPTPTMQYEATLETSKNTQSASDLISIDTTGKVSVQLASAAAATTYTVLFCPSANSGAPASQTPSCFTVGSVSTDINGSASTSMQFPQPGSWAGDFQLNAGANPEYETDVMANTTGQLYMSTLQPEKSVNGGVLSEGGQGTQNPLSNGTVTFTNSNYSLTFTLTGGPANTSVTATENALDVGGSESYVLYNSQNQDSFETNASGNLTFTVQQDGLFGDVFVVSPQNDDNGYVGGFLIPAS